MGGPVIQLMEKVRSVCLDGQFVQSSKLTLILKWEKMFDRKGGVQVMKHSLFQVVPGLQMIS